MRKTLRLIGVVALLGAITAACGDDDDGLSKSEFLTQANAICRDGNEKFEALFDDFPVTQGALAGFFKKARPIVEEEAEDLRALEPPADDEDAVEEILDALDRSVEDFERSETDVAFATRIFGEEGGENNKEAEEKAAAYGLTECAEGEDDDDDEEELNRLDPAAFPADKQAYIAEADAICKVANDEFRPIEQSAFDTFPPPLESWAEFLPKVVATFRPALAELRKLQPPAGDQATITELLDRQSAALDALEEGGGLAAAGDEDRFTEVVSPAFFETDEIDAAFVAYGFQVCGPDDDADDA